MRAAKAFPGVVAGYSGMKVYPADGYKEARGEPVIQGKG